jgi:hypothetical protein
VSAQQSRLNQTLQAAADHGADFVVIDTPAKSDSAAIEAARVAGFLMQVLDGGTTNTPTSPVKRTTVEQWTRRSGNLILGITPGRDFENDRSIGYPYGVIPRLLLLWIITEAVQTKSRRLLLGRSLADFMGGVGLSPNTGRGKRSDAKRLHEQMDRLFSSRINSQ